MDDTPATNGLINVAFAALRYLDARESVNIARRECKRLEHSGNQSFSRAMGAYTIEKEAMRARRRAMYALKRCAERLRNTCEYDPIIQHMLETTPNTDGMAEKLRKDLEDE